MQKRRAIVAGQFYPGDKEKCISEIEQMLSEIKLETELPEKIVGAIVPHAGWFFSGKLALEVFQAVKQQNEKVDTFVIFGTSHGYFGDIPAAYDKGAWSTPLGDISIDEELAKKIRKKELAISDSGAHKYEHSIEVQVPFIQHMFEGAEIIPVIVSPNENAVALGEGLAEIITEETEKQVVCIGSTDLTHYGPRYGFEPQGTGEEALKWASDVNDEEFIQLANDVKPAQLLDKAMSHHNACGPGAAAAVVAFAGKLGRTKGILLDKDNSNNIMQQKMGRSSEESVGYASIIF